MKKVYSLLLVICIGAILVMNFSAIFVEDYQLPDEQLGSHYIEQGVEDTGVINLVTAILFEYRAFDTLGEATVIFTAVSIALLLVKRRRIFIAHTNFSPIVHQTISFVLPFLYILGIYLVIYGHLSPGGGFTGGVVIATIFILLMVTFGIRHVHEKRAIKFRALLEDAGAVGFIFIGLLGVLAGYNFLANSQANFPLGSPGQLLSGGTVPLLNLMVGLKVGTGLAIIFYCLAKEE